MMARFEGASLPGSVSGQGSGDVKYHVGIGQDAFSVPAPDEDIVTMGAAAAKEIVDRHGVEGIRTVLFATESGVDQSKAAGVFVHGLLGTSLCLGLIARTGVFEGSAVALLGIDQWRFTAPVFLDCTGDGLVGALAGASYRIGREGRDEYGEEW
ncbi:FAD-dependent oxidoreductase, partial [Bacillus sp. S34]|nr:FAD-dependent oxidoreductase [Bacillus sp. S34]